MLRDTCIQDWVGIHRNRLLAMMFTDFMAEFKLAYLPKNWEEITHIELLQLTQADTSFWDFSIIVQVKNSSLSGTRSHLDKTQLHHCIKSGMNATLALHCCLEKITSDGTLTEWLDDVSHVDDLLHTECTNFDALTKNSCEASRQTSTFAEPPRHSNSNNNNTIPASANCIALPKLIRAERQLLYDNDSCLKRQCVFVTHHSTNCPDNFPEAANY